MMTAIAACALPLSLPCAAEAADTTPVVAVFDSNQLRGAPLPLAGSLTAALRECGCQVITLTPSGAADPKQMRRERLDVLIYLGADHTIAIGQRCIEYLKQGGRLWYVGDSSPFSGSAFIDADGTGRFVPVSPATSEAALRRRAGLANPNAAKTPTSSLLTRRIHRGSMFTWRAIAADKIIDPPTPQPRGRPCFSRSIDAYCKAAVEGKVMVLSLRSGDMPWVRPSCKVVGFAKTKYRFPIWCGGRMSTSAGYPLGMIADRCGELGGARTLFAGRSALERLSKAEEDWRAFVREAVWTLLQDDLVAVVTPRRAIVDVGETLDLEIRFDNYLPRPRRIAAKLEARRRGSEDRRFEISKRSIDLQSRGQDRRSIPLDTNVIGAGLFDLVLSIDGKVSHRHVLSVLPGPSVPLTRRTFWDNPHAGRFVIMFRSFDDVPGNIPFAIETGLQGFSIHIPWVPGGTTVETAINWPVLDHWIRDATAQGLKVIIDAWDHRPYPQYFTHFKQGKSRRHWEKYPSVAASENRQRWAALWGAVAKRYASNAAVVGMFLSPSATSSFQIDLSDAVAGDFVTYLRQHKGFTLTQLAERYGMAVPSWRELRPPDVDHPAGNMVARVLDYSAFWQHQHGLFLEASAKAIRQAAPNMALLLRGAYRYAPNFRQAAKLMDTYGPISIHAENVETTIDTHTPMFGGHLRYGVPITAENGWPACRGEPARHAFFKALMGHYNAFLYSGGGSFQILPNLDCLAEYAYLDACLKRTRPVLPRVAILINETTQLLPAIGMKLAPKWNTPRFHRALFHLGYPAMATNVDDPDLTGLDIAIDGGNNTVVRRTVLRSLLTWVAQGHTLVISKTMAAFSDPGRVEPLADQLRSPEGPVHGIPADMIRLREPFLEFADGKAVEGFDVGDGKVLVLDDVAHEQKQMNATFEPLLEKLRLERPVVCDPAIPLVVREDDRSLYLILYDVHIDAVGGYFNYDDASEDLKLSETVLDVTITAPFKPAAAVDLARNERLEAKGRHVHFSLRRGHGMVARLDRAQRSR